MNDLQTGGLWVQYQSLRGKDEAADAVLATLRVLVQDRAREIPQGDWKDKVTRALRDFNIPQSGISFFLKLDEDPSPLP